MQTNYQFQWKCILTSFKIMVLKFKVVECSDRTFVTNTHKFLKNDKMMIAILLEKRLHSIPFMVFCHAVSMVVI